jgi:superfamily I DNA/RNA helicase
VKSEDARRSIFVVGDKRQAIMKFQGANPENIDLLIDDFDCKELELTTNHRATSDRIKALT